MAGGKSAPTQTSLKASSMARGHRPSLGAEHGEGESWQALRALPPTHAAPPALPPHIGTPLFMPLWWEPWRGQRSHGRSRGH